MVITAVRTVILYAAITAAMRLMGKRQLGQLHPSELVVALLIADLAAVPMQDVDLPLLQGLLPIGILVALELLLSICMLKFPVLARLIAGNPLCVIRKGKILPDQLKRLRLSVEDLCEQLRQQSVFDPTQVNAAYVESNGQLSVLLQPEQQTITVGGQPEAEPMLPVISDGAVIPWALRDCGWTREQLYAVLRGEAVPLDRVLLLTADVAGNYHLLRRRETP